MHALPHGVGRAFSKPPTEQQYHHHHQPRGVDRRCNASRPGSDSAARRSGTWSRFTVGVGGGLASGYCYNVAAMCPRPRCSPLTQLHYYLSYLRTFMCSVVPGLCLHNHLLLQCSEACCSELQRGSCCMTHVATCVLWVVAVRRDICMSCEYKQWAIGHAVQQLAFYYDDAACPTHSPPTGSSISCRRAQQRRCWWQSHATRWQHH